MDSQLVRWMGENSLCIIKVIKSKINYYMDDIFTKIELSMKETVYWQ